MEQKKKQENKKVLNAQVTVVSGITFKSKLEATTYKKLSEAGLNPLYEPEKFILWEGIKLDKVAYYCPVKERGKPSYLYDQYPRKLIHISYTPDFVIKYKDYIAFVCLQKIGLTFFCISDF